MKYTQGAEHYTIERYFGDAPIGTFLDLGANDGVKFSNTRALFERGWTGALVDASPRAFARLQATYAGVEGVELHNVAIAEREGWVTLHESGPHAGDDVGLLSSTLLCETTKWRPTTEFTTVTVPAITVGMLLDRSRFDHFDMISIDIEGCDLLALEALDLTALRTRMVIVEVNERDVTPYVAHCAAHGLELVSRTPENLIFAK